MFRSPQRRLLWARILIPVMFILAVVTAVEGVWPTSIGMVFLIATQVFVYRKAKEELEAGE